MSLRTAKESRQYLAVMCKMKPPGDYPQAPR
jgi:hypothetical protein